MKKKRKSDSIHNYVVDNQLRIYLGGSVHDNNLEFYPKTASEYKKVYDAHKSGKYDEFRSKIQKKRGW